MRLALRKAVDVSRKHPEAIVLGADTIVTCRGDILLKPRGLKDSERILKTLNGRWQKVYTGIALSFDGGRITLCRAVMSRVLARRLSEERLQDLVGKHMDKAGGYAVQDSKDPFIARVEGDIDNVVGLPVKDLRLLLKRFKRRLGADRAGAARSLSRRSSGEARRKSRRPSDERPRRR